MMRRALILAFGVAALAPAGALEAQAWRDVTVSRTRSEQSELEVRIRYGAGELDLKPSSDPGLLYRADLRYDEDKFEPVAEYEDGVLEVGVTTIGRNINVGKQSQAHLDVILSKEVAIALDMEVGAAEVDLDLSGLRLRSLDLETGASKTSIKVSERNPVRMSLAEISAGAAEFRAEGLGNLNADHISVDAGVGEVTLDFSGGWSGETQVELDMGLGALHLTFPEGLGVRIRKDSFLTSFDAEGLVKRGNAYYSSAWDNASARVDIQLDAAFGSIDINWIGDS